MKKKLADTTLAYWLDRQMALWSDPDTNRTGISQRKLGVLAGVPQSMISGILTRGLIPNMKTLANLGRVFQVHPLVIYYIAYHLEENSREALEKLTELGRTFYQMPDGVLFAFFQSDDLKKLLAEVNDSDSDTGRLRQEGSAR